jgi:hypothetical protein
MSKLLALSSFLVVSASSAWAQTPAPGPAPTVDAGATGWIGTYWWMILLILIVLAAAWYFSRRSRSL